MSEFRSVLQLSQGYVPMYVVSWRRAANLVIGRGKANILEEYITAGQFKPAVIVLNTWSPDPFTMFQKKGFSKKNVHLRDLNKCQYCSKDCVGKDLTIDHIVPSSRGGRTTYTNCVTCCKKCNAYKGDFSLERAGMSLIQNIRAPNIYDIFKRPDLPLEWKKYVENYSEKMV